MGRPGQHSWYQAAPSEYNEATPRRGAHTYTVIFMMRRPKAMLTPGRGMKPLKKLLLRLTVSPVLLILLLLSMVADLLRYKYKHVAQENEVIEVVKQQDRIGTFSR